jgi:hypothetical protein
MPRPSAFDRGWKAAPTAFSTTGPALFQQNWGSGLILAPALPRGNVNTCFEPGFFEPQNIGQGISNFEVGTSSFCGFLFDIRYSNSLARTWRPLPTLH